MFTTTGGRKRNWAERPFTKVKAEGNLGIFDLARTGELSSVNEEASARS